MTELKFNRVGGGADLLLTGICWWGHSKYRLHTWISEHSRKTFMSALVPPWKHNDFQQAPTISHSVMFIHFLSTGCDYGAPALAIWFAVPGSADSRTLRGAHLHPSLLLFSITVGDLKFNNNCLHAPISLCSLILATSPQVLVWKDINYCDPLVTIICKVPTLMANLSQLISGGKKKKKRYELLL